jgi:DNA-binding GntR family transcriptional regulator
MPAVIQLKTPSEATLDADALKMQASSHTLSTKALYIEVAELLRQRIFKRTSGDLEPGSWIDELKLAEEYGISRTPLREALKVLATEGLVTMKVRRGAYVTEVSEQDLSDVYHLLSLLESDAAGVVASTATDAQMTELGKLHEALEAAVPDAGKSAKNKQVIDTERFFSINEQFHMRLLAIANNKWRDQMVADLRKVMKLNRHNSLLKAGRIAESLDEHRAIMSALYARDAAATVAAMKAHFKNGLEAAG